MQGIRRGGVGGKKSEGKGEKCGSGIKKAIDNEGNVNMNQEGDKYGGDKKGLMRG